MYEAVYILFVLNIEVLLLLFGYKVAFLIELKIEFSRLLILLLRNNKNSSSCQRWMKLYNFLYKFLWMWSTKSENLMQYSNHKVSLKESFKITVNFNYALQSPLDCGFNSWLRLLAARRLKACSCECYVSYPEERGNKTDGDVEN